MGTVDTAARRSWGREVCGRGEEYGGRIGGWCEVGTVFRETEREYEGVFKVWINLGRRNKIGKI